MLKTASLDHFQLQIIEIIFEMAISYIKTSTLDTTLKL